VPDAEGNGETITTDPPTVQRALALLALCATRHGGVDHVSVHVDGAELTLAPVTEAAAPVILGEDMKDLGAAVAVSALRALGGTVEVSGEALRVKLA
jgi:hypothetical protein